MLEELYSYVEDYERRTRSGKIQNSVKNTIFTLNERFTSKINSIRSPAGRYYIFIFIENLYNHLIDIILDKIKSYNENSDNKGMVEFSNFLDAAFNKSLYNRRIYTLNYDNWFNKFRGYFD